MATPTVFPSAILNSRISLVVPTKPVKIEGQLWPRGDVDGA